MLNNFNRTVGTIHQSETFPQGKVKTEAEIVRQNLVWDLEDAQRSGNREEYARIRVLLKNMPVA